jgi:basic membrane protein A
MKRRVFLVVLAASLVGLLFALPSLAKIEQICMYYDQTGRGDLSFNDMAALGAEQAAAEFGLEMGEITAGSSADYLPDLLTLARSGECSVIIGVGFLLADALPEAARQFPDAKFAFIDGESGGIENVLGVLFKEEQGAAPIGALAALAAIADRYSTVAYLGGMEIPPVWRYEGGFRFGVHWALDWYERTFGEKKLVTILGQYVGRFDDPAGGKTAAQSQLAVAAHSIFGIAGLSHLGAFDAVEEEARALGREIGPPYAFGADASQEYVKPGFVLASARKRVDVGSYTAAKQAYEGTFQGGTTLLLGIAEAGVGVSTLDDIIDFIDIGIAAGQLTPDEKEATLDKIQAARAQIPTWVWDAVAELEGLIARGEIEVPSASTAEQIAQVRQQYP